MNKNSMKTVSILAIMALFFLYSCSSTKKDDTEIKEKKFEPNVEKRAEAYRDKGGGIFNSNRLKNNNFDFATSNVLWRATLSTLEFIPLNNVDYSGGVVVTDWYSFPDSKESIKITVHFLSNELAVSSIKIISHKKICKKEFDCIIQLASNNFNQEIKNKIILKAKELKIFDEKNKK